MYLKIEHYTSNVRKFAIQLNVGIRGTKYVDMEILTNLILSIFSAYNSVLKSKWPILVLTSLS